MLFVYKEEIIPLVCIKFILVLVIESEIFMGLL